MENLRIVIVTAYYYPLNVPRAFRATELAHEFARRGHQVTVINAITVLNSDGVLLSIDKTPNVKLINLHAFKWCIDSSKKVQYSNSGFFSNIKQYLWKFLFYISTNKWFYLYLKVKNLLTFEQKYDLLISIGLPFAIHWAVAHKIAGRNIADCYVADYGDPFSKFNIATKVAPYFQFIEKKCINRFDFISIPTDIAINSYRWLKDDDHIKVIPQGFNFNGIKLSTYTPNSVPTFAFAGLFYSDIRNPQIFLDFLSDFTLDFRFVIYTNINVQDSMKCLRPYIDKLDGRMLIIDSIPRDKLILELSKMDFLINVKNSSNNQSPSKLIDYTLANRPIFSFSSKLYDSERFLRFYNGIYDNLDSIDLSQFNIVNVANQFLNLYYINQ